MYRLFLVGISVLLVQIVYVFTTEALQGTPRNLRDIFIGQCLYYQSVLNPGPFQNGKEKNCSLLWESFSKAWIGKDQCNIPKESYAEFVRDAFHDFPTDKSCLWHHTYDFTTEYATGGKRVTRIALTLTGYVADNIKWCGKTEPPGIDYSPCKQENNKTCKSQSELAFWRAASEKYALSLNGTVQVFLNGSGDRPAFDNTSITAVNEIHVLNVSKISLVEVIIVHDIGKKVSETCERGASIQLFKRELERRRLPFSCQDNPPSVLDFLCIEHPEDDQCRKRTGFDTFHFTMGILTCLAFIGAMYLVVKIHHICLNSRKRASTY